MTALPAALPDPAEVAAFPARDGYHWSWREEDPAHWRPTAYGDERRCRWTTRRVRCEFAVRAELHRGNGWWGYCAEHLYGRRLVDGRVWHIVLEADAEETP